MTKSQTASAARLESEYPMSLGMHDQYASVQGVVDHLSDQGFPVARSLFGDRNPAGLPGHRPPARSGLRAGLESARLHRGDPAR